MKLGTKISLGFSSLIAIAIGLFVALVAEDTLGSAG